MISNGIGASADHASEENLDGVDIMDIEGERGGKQGSVDAADVATVDAPDGVDAVIPPSAADVAWCRLRRHLERYELEETHVSSSRLRIVAIEAVLSAHRRLCLPPWILAPFISAPGLGPLLQRALSRSTKHTETESETASSKHRYNDPDVAALVRTYMNYGRESEAAAVAVKYLAVVTDSMPSMVLGRPAAVCIPHALFQELIERVPQTVPARQQLVEKLGKVEAAAVGQTEVIEGIYA